jgi:hypothetical protein
MSDDPEASCLEQCEEAFGRTAGPELKSRRGFVKSLGALVAPFAAGSLRAQDSCCDDGTCHDTCETSCQDTCEVQCEGCQDACEESCELLCENMCEDTCPTPTKAAKAALEAGENEKASDYAVRALRAAGAEAENLKRMYALMGNLKSPGRDAYVDYYANLVLGRLAILKADIRSAETYLLAAGKTSGEWPSLCTYGPNLSLALEVLRHGDTQSRRVVLEFIGEISKWWLVANPPFDEWSNQIRAGEPPDFQRVGNNLYY